MRRLSLKEKVVFKRSRWLLLKNPWNLTGDQKERLSTMVWWNTPIVRAYCLKESFQLFWPLRANIDETVLLVVITEQGENRNQCEEQWISCGFPHGFARRGT